MVTNIAKISLTSETHKNRKERENLVTTYCRYPNGSLTVKVEPLPRDDSTDTIPLWLSTRSLMKLNPIPMPS